MRDFWRDVWSNFWAILLWPYRVARAVFYALLDGSDGSNLDNSGLFEHTTDITSPFTDSTSAWGSGATGYYGGSTEYWPSTTAMPMTTYPPPTTPPPPPAPKPVTIPDLDAPRMIDLD
ncbi:MAG: hypothetical protein WC919_05570 [Candidatus Paceibacterota bacterium]